MRELLRDIWEGQHAISVTVQILEMARETCSKDH